MYVQGRDILAGPTGRAVVRVHGRRPRTVVCRYAYEELLLAEAAHIPADAYAFRPDWQDRTSKHTHRTGWPGTRGSSAVVTVQGPRTGIYTQTNAT
ncbi:hypothetical protein RKD30_006142 [Streptomyces pristinaespiralis]